MSLEDRTERLNSLGNVEGSWEKKGEVQLQDVKLGDGVSHFIHITDDAALLKVAGAILAMQTRGTVFRPGGRIEFALDHGLVSFNKKGINPLATQGSWSGFLVPTIIETSPALDSDLQLLVGVVEQLESLRGLL
jgi:hypothetical protein